ncbi:MAG TPA: hypothetical protein VNO32_20105 [Candidatus Acidoferrum sp.]|nr:hypothetical protein [Candidatus Acidoferrum sp.]
MTRYPKPSIHQQHADQPGEELRVDAQVCHGEAIESEKYQADGKPMFEQLKR